MTRALEEWLEAMEQGESDLDALPEQFILDLGERLRTEVAIQRRPGLAGYKGATRHPHRACVVEVPRLS